MTVVITEKECQLYLETKKVMSSLQEPGVELCETVN